MEETEGRRGRGRCDGPRIPKAQPYPSARYRSPPPSWSSVAEPLRLSTGHHRTHINHHGRSGEDTLQKPDFSPDRQNPSVAKAEHSPAAPAADRDTSTPQFLDPAG